MTANKYLIHSLWFWIVSLLFPYLIIVQLCAEPIQESVYNFKKIATDTNALVLASDGFLYGTNAGGGNSGDGTAFKISKLGILTNLANFDGQNGSRPSARLIQGRDGNFYGTTLGGGKSGKGTVFNMTSSGKIRTLVNFNGTNGHAPSAALIQANDGSFYGTTSKGGTYDKGTVFNITNLELFSTLVNFDGTNGQHPMNSLLQVKNGNFYGTTFGRIDENNPSKNDSGTLFSMSPQGVLITLIDFNDKVNAHPTSDLIQAQDGDLYLGSFAKVYRVKNDGTDIREIGAGSIAVTTLLQTQDSNIYCTGAAGISGAGLLHLYPQIYKLTNSGDFNSFCQIPSSGNSSNLIIGSDGDFFGSTSSNSIHESGTIFKVDSTGKLFDMFSFQRNSYSPNFFKLLMQDNGGDLYGVALGIDLQNYGQIFKMTRSGSIITFAQLKSESLGIPQSIFKSRDGNFYGITHTGTQRSNIFKITPQGIFSILTNFGNQKITLMQSRGGVFYGTTESDGDRSKGTIFTMSPSGKLETLVNFNGTNGQSPSAPLVQDNLGDFYGTTKRGGGKNGGTAFKVTISGKLTTLVNFESSTGISPETALIQASDGCFYGHTSEAGNLGFGGVFRFIASGKLSVILWKDYDKNVSGPLIQGNDGNFYGTVKDGYRSFEGFFKLSPVGKYTSLLELGASYDAPEYLIKGNEGDIYGSTFGLSESRNSDGKVFRLRFIKPDIALKDQFRKQLIDNFSKVNWGKSQLNKRGITKTFEIENVGSSSLTNITIEKTGLNSKDFRLSALPKNSLLPGASTTFQVIFRPKFQGPRKAVIHIKSNDPDEDSFDVKISGIGIR